MSKFLLTAAAVIVILAGLKASQTLVAPFLLAVFFAMVLMPPLRWLKQKGLSDTVAVFTLSSIVFLFGLVMIGVFSSSLTNFAAKLPEYQKKTTAYITEIDGWLNSLADKFSQVEESLPRLPKITELQNDDSANEVLHNTLLAEQKPQKERFSLLNVIQVNTLMHYTTSAVAGLLNFVTYFFLVAVLVIFMLLEAAQLPQKVKEAFAGRDLSNEYFDKIAADTWNYTKIKTIVSFLTGAATAAGLWFLGVEYALLWGILMFFLNYIPNIGQFIAGVPPVLLALVDQGAGTAAAAAVWITLVNTAFGYGVELRYLGEGLGISSLVVLISLVFWGWLLGPVGMFLSAPLTMVLKIVLQNIPSTRWLAVLLSSRVNKGNP
jgi:predicted PurR-regulated permease PerM